MTVVGVEAPRKGAPARDDARAEIPAPVEEADDPRGKEVFEKHCAACHRQDGAGLIGPNLTDRCFLHGSRRSDTERVVARGVPAKGMPGWEQILGDEDRRAVARFVDGLRGRELSGKGCEGAVE